MGIMHKSRFNEGDRINDSFVLIRNYMRKTTIKGKNEWLWECKCDCGNIFHCRENKLINRRGCHSCTNQLTQKEVWGVKKKGILHFGIKNRLYKDYRAGATKRGKCFELSFDEFVSIMEKDCFYCGLKPQLHPYEIQYMQKKTDPWKHTGIDRIDSSRGYTIDNCVPCCSKCNYAKHEMTISEFKEYITFVYNKLVLEGSTTIPKGSTSQAIGGGNGVHPNKDEDIV